MTKYLPIYLNDHLAGAVAAVQLARRAAGQNEGTEYGEALAGLAGEIDQDRRTLQDLLKRLGIRGDPVKLLSSVVAEKLGRFKLNGELLRYSPLSRLEEIELLMLGVEVLFEDADTVASYLTQGWTVTATDYPGLGTPGGHPYLVGDSEGRAVIDSV